MPLDETRFFVQSLCNSWRRYHLPPSAQWLNSPPIISNHRDYQRKFSQQRGREQAITITLAQYGRKSEDDWVAHDVRQTQRRRRSGPAYRNFGCL